jgi:hypothetical protein
VAANRAPYAHRDPVGQATSVVGVSARPNASCVGSYGILANRALRICRSILQCFGSSSNLSSRRSNRNRVKEVAEWKSHHERSGGTSSLNRLLMNTIGQFQQTHLVQHKSRHNGIARWRANEINSATEKLVTPLNNAP